MGESYTGVRVINVSPEIINNVYKNKKILLSDLDGRLTRHLSQNEYCVLKFENPPHSQSALTRVIGEELVLLYNDIHASGITPRNKEQRMALDALLDDRIKVVVLTGRAGTGKAQSLDSKILTPNGWTTMGEIQPGDKILSPSGELATVDSVHPQGILEMYRVNFSDGSSTECCMNHLWYTKTQKDRDAKRPGTVKTLAEIASTLHYGKAKKRNHSIPMVRNLSFEEDSLELDPYLLGVLLGDGAMSVGAISFSSADPQLITNIENIVAQYDMKVQYASGYDYRIIHKTKSKWCDGNHIKNILKKFNLWGRTSERKFIPSLFHFSSLTSRQSLLQGLLDTDGTIDKRTGNITFCSTSHRLAEDVRFLVMSLGGKAKIKEKQPIYTYKGKKKLGKISYIVAISLPNNVTPFRLARKLNYVIPKTKYPPRRYIDSIESVGCKLAQCIHVNSKDHLYITDDFIVTHNTLLTLAAAIDKFDTKKYDRLILTRPMSWVGKHGLGYLPGEVDEKFGPYLENYMCNIEFLLNGKYKNIPDFLSQYRMDFVPLQLIRGASWANAFIIADEVQTLGYDEMVALGTRVGENSKIVIMGDLGQRDEAIPREKTGIYKLVNDPRTKASPLVASIDLIKCERSPVAALFADVFER